MFTFGDSLIISVKDPLEIEPSYLDFEFKIVRVGNRSQKLIIRCQVFNEFDQELWETFI